MQGDGNLVGYINVKAFVEEGAKAFCSSKTSQGLETQWYTYQLVFETSHDLVIYRVGKCRLSAGTNRGCVQENDTPMKIWSSDTREASWFSVAPNRVAD